MQQLFAKKGMFILTYVRELQSSRASLMEMNGYTLTPLNQGYLNIQSSIQ
jgi:hypothetical protein